MVESRRRAVIRPVSRARRIHLFHTGTQTWFIKFFGPGPDWLKFLDPEPHPIYWIFSDPDPDVDYTIDIIMEYFVFRSSVLVSIVLDTLLRVTRHFRATIINDTSARPHQHPDTLRGSVVRGNVVSRFSGNLGDNFDN
jgi:hypothetical protein